MQSRKFSCGSAALHSTWEAFFSSPELLQQQLEPVTTWFRLPLGPLQVGKIIFELCHHRPRTNAKAEITARLLILTAAASQLWPGYLVDHMDCPLFVKCCSAASSTPLYCTGKAWTAVRYVPCIHELLKWETWPSRPGLFVKTEGIHLEAQPVQMSMGFNGVENRRYPRRQRRQNLGNKRAN